MPISIRIPPETEKKLKKLAKKTGKTKTALILESLNEKLGLQKNREQQIRSLAGFMSHEEAERLRRSVSEFDLVRKEEWE